MLNPESSALYVPATYLNNDILNNVNFARKVHMYEPPEWVLGTPPIIAAPWFISYTIQ